MKFTESPDEDKLVELVAVMSLPGGGTRITSMTSFIVCDHHVPEVRKWQDEVIADFDLMEPEKEEARWYRLRMPKADLFCSVCVQLGSRSQTVRPIGRVATELK